MTELRVQVPGLPQLKVLHSKMTELRGQVPWPPQLNLQMSKMTELRGQDSSPPKLKVQLDQFSTELRGQKVSILCQIFMAFPHPTILLNLQPTCPLDNCQTLSHNILVFLIKVLYKPNDCHFKLKFAYTRVKWSISTAQPRFQTCLNSTRKNSLFRFVFQSPSNVSR